MGIGGDAMLVSRKKLLVPVFVVALAFASATANATTLEKAARIKEATVSTDEVAAIAVTQVSTGMLHKFEVVELNGAQVRKTASLLWKPLARSPDTTMELTGASEWTVDSGPSGGDVTIEISSEDFDKMVEYPNEMRLYFQGRLKVAGNTSLATKLQALLK